MTSRKSRITYIIPSPMLCGGIATVCQHVNRLARRGFDISIVSVSPEGSLDWFPGHSVPIYSLSNMPTDIEIGIATWWETTHTLHELEIPRKFYFVQSDEIKFYSEGRYERIFAHDSYRCDYEFITQARWIQRWLDSEFGKKAHYVPNGIDPEIFHPADPIEPKRGTQRVLIEGPADMPSKGVGEAFEAVNGLGCEIWYVNYRGIPDPSWKPDRYFYAVPMSQMKNIYSSCDILLKLSTVEGSFCPPLEMMACGGVCVVSEVTGIEEAIIPEENALVVKQGDIEGARRAIKRLMEDQKLRSRLIANGAKTVERLDWDKSIDILERIFLSPPKRKTTSLSSIERRAKEEAFINAYSHIRKMESLLRESEHGRQKDIELLRSEINRRDSDIQTLHAVLQNEIGNRDREIDSLRDEIRSRDKEVATLRDEVSSLRHMIDLKNNELNSIYLSKQWKIASAILEARHSAAALLKLPWRIIRHLSSSRS